jgi:catechol 2,3-dioxygenase-like lactoylglutathione lyase family enzyme
MSKSLPFYRGVLGATIVGEGGTSVIMKFLGDRLLLATGGGPTEDKPTVTFTPPEDVDRVSASFTIRVKDCGGLYETSRSRGAEFLTPPVRSQHEVRAFFRDPDGYLFELSEIPGA